MSEQRYLVTCNGCFDGLHPGHMFLLGFVAGQMRPCDELVVFINSDDYISRTKRQQPHFTEAARVNHLLATGIVDDVVVFNDSNAADYIRRYQPRIHCVSKAYAGGCPEIDACKEIGTEVAIIPTVGNWSSTALKGRTVYDETCV